MENIFVFDFIISNLLDELSDQVLADILHFTQLKKSRMTQHICQTFILSFR